MDVLAIHDREAAAALNLSIPDGTSELSADAILIATGRRPNTDGRTLENTGVQTDARCHHDERTSANQRCP
jgi:pyruvate/2-oxoglutarate dehydrogenase complex dihydrolipoamide dehydrogenase (E3) component